MRRSKGLRLLGGCFSRFALAGLRQRIGFMRANLVGTSLDWKDGKSKGDDYDIKSYELQFSGKGVDIDFDQRHERSTTGH